VETWKTFGEDWANLPADVREALAKFLVQLQRNPYDPDIQKQVELGEGERFAFALPKGYVLYWRVDCNSLSIDKLDVNITLLGIGRR
jgi:mRNA-degrading endonuclease RelE of RelBE toxin-antitoxin system